MFSTHNLIRFVLPALLCFAGMFTYSAVATAQARYTVAGTVKDKKSGEEMIGASVAVEELKGTGAATNEYGFYSLTLPEGDYTLVFSGVGFTPETRKIALRKDLKIDVAFGANEELLKEVTVSATRKDENLSRATMGVEKVDVASIAKVPVLFGEKDILKTIQLLPGIKSAGEGSAGFYVRGGTADQNLILLDEAPVYNASHLLGFFSTFNSDAIKDVEVYKGTAPAQYGGRLSSVLDIKMNEGNNQDYHVSGGLGLISSKLNVEGPLVKDKGSFLVTGRRTYADLFLKLSPDKSISENQLYFYDFNAKANYRIDDKNRIFLSGYFGRDVFGINGIFGIEWGNATATLRWNHIVNSRLFSNTSLIYSNYDYKISITANNNDIAIRSKIRDYNLKQEFQYFPDPKSVVKFGFNVVHHTMTPGQVTVSAGSSFNPITLQDRYALDNSLYASHEWAATPKLNVTYGLRVVGFSLLGGGEFYTYDSYGNAATKTNYANGENVATYINLEPRASASYRIDDANSIKAAYTRNTQNLHLLSNSTASTPTDLWIPSSINVKPEVADQGSLGYFHNFLNNTLELSVEAYYKAMQNQIDYKNGANVNANEKIEGELLYGQGRAYGIEMLLRKKTGKFTGWVSYTLSRSERLIDGINNNNWYAAKQDRTHDISVVGIYELNKKWSFSATWVYYTGNAVTFPSGKYNINGQSVFVYSERNGYRMPDYHRLDLGATVVTKKTKRYESSWNFSVYNAYARANAYSISFQDDPNDPTRTQAVQTTLFKIVPSVTWNFKF